MENQQAKPKGILNVLTTIHFAITLGLIALGMFFYWLRDDWMLDFFGLFTTQASGNMAYLLITASMVMMMVFERPRKEKAESDLDLNRELKIELGKAMKVNK